MKNICEICGKKYVLSCKACYRRVIAWGDEGAYQIIQIAQQTNDINAEDIMKFVDLYYIGKSKTRTAKANTFKTALRLLGYNGSFIGRIHKNGTSYLSLRRRENGTARRHSLKKNECEKCGATNDLHMHHITPLSWGGLSNPENIITLCEPCHRKVHRRLQKYLNRSLLLRYLEEHLGEINELSLLSISDNENI